MERYAKKPAFITLKDHKQNFRQNPKCRLINPAKSEIGIISKKILEKTNAEILSKLKLNQWRNTASVISWFRKIQNKKNYKFLKFDIVEFYPSITEDLLSKSLNFAQKLTNINKTDIQIIRNARKSVLFSNHETWIKLNDNNLFDVTMGSFDGAEICELVGLYLLNELSDKFGKNNVGIYRDGGLAILPDIPGPDADRARKELHEIFGNHNLKITAELNLIRTDVMDVTLDLKTGTYSRYCKPENKPQYINIDSNHPPSIKKHLPYMINKRLSDISSDAEVFNKLKHVYEKSLKENGYTYNMVFIPNNQQKKKRARKRNIIWFNPPYNISVKNNIGKIFFNLIQKHFPPNHKFRSIFNRNNLKLSYSCTKNIENIVKSHNAKIINNTAQTQITKPCNCRIKNECPMNGDCRTECIVYKATVTTSNNSKHYFGISEGEFKTRYYNHVKSFKSRANRSDTELSKYLWTLKDSNIPFTLVWSIAAKTFKYKCGSRKCDLCTTEKYFIAMTQTNNLLNKKSEIVSKCRHRTKFCYYKYIKINK